VEPVRLVLLRRVDSDQAHGGRTTRQLHPDRVPVDDVEHVRVERRSRMRDTAEGDQGENDREAQVRYPRWTRPVSECAAGASTPTRTSSPGVAGPGNTTVFIPGLLPAIQPAGRRAGPSTSTSTSSPTSARLISAEIDSWRAINRWRRRAFSSSGTESPQRK